MTARIGAEEWCPWRFWSLTDCCSPSVTRNCPRFYTDEHLWHRTIVGTTPPWRGVGYVRKLRDAGVNVWVLKFTGQERGVRRFSKKMRRGENHRGLFRGRRAVDQRTAAHAGTGLFLCLSRGPVLFADEKAKGAVSVPAPRTPGPGRPAGRRAARGPSATTSWMRGRVVYPEKLLLDETAFSQR